MTPLKRDLNQLPWAAALAFRSFGATIAVRSNCEAALASVRNNLPPSIEVSSTSSPDQVYSIWVEPRISPSPICSLYRGSSLLAACDSVAKAGELLQSSLHLGVAMHSTYLFVHAGVVGWGGRAILIPGDSYAGKSTLVAELVRQGAVYYSDEYAVLDEEGWAHSYPKPLSLRRPQSGPRQVTLSELGGTADRRPLRVGLVAAAKYRAEAIWRPTVLSAAESMMVLIEHTVMARARPELTMRTLRHAVLDSSGLCGDRGEAHECAAFLLHAARTASAEKCDERHTRNRTVAGL